MATDRSRDVPPTPIADGCVVCGPNVSYATHYVAEGMFQTGEVFEYHECARCGSLQISKVPDNLSEYYNTDTYYSFRAPQGRLSSRWINYRPARAALKINTQMYLRTGIGKRLAGLEWVKKAGLELTDRILDLGCGGGEQLLRLRLYGFSYLTGADPFLPQDTEPFPGLYLQRADHTQVTGRYDWVMMHHAFEHVSDPREVLRSCRRLLSPRGRILLRIPVMGSLAWREYGTYWVQIDPPRHLVLFTAESLRELAESEGFEVEKVFYDSTEFQFSGSEAVSRSMPHSSVDQFEPDQRLSWERRARQLNRANDGDQAGFVLRPIYDAN